MMGLDLLMPARMTEQDLEEPSMKSRLRSWLKRRKTTYAFVGALVGLTFPFGAMIIEILVHKSPFTLQSFFHTHADHPVFWFVDTAPIVLGYIASLVGRREDRLDEMAGQLELQVEERTAEILRQHQFFEALVQNSPLPIVTLDEMQDIVAANPAFEKMFGFPQSEIVGKKLDPLITTESTYDQAKDYTIRTEAGETVRGTGVRRRKDGTLLDVEIHGVPVIVQGIQIGVLALYNDITERKRADDALKDSEARYRSLFDDSPISLWEEDFSQVKAYLDELKQSGVTNYRSYFERNPEAVATCASLVKITNVNEATLRLYQATSKDELLEGLTRVMVDEAMVVFEEELIALARGARHFESEVAQVTMTGDKILSFMSLTVAPGSEETWEKVYVSVIDITERVRLEEELKASLARMESLARTDPLTGSLNRRAITEQALAELARSERERTSLGLAIVDLDFLKDINDRHGHLVGDAALRLLAETIEKACRLYDRVGRWGGDEFMVVLPNVEPESVKAIAHRLLKRVNEAKLSVPQGDDIHLEICIGVTASSPDDGRKMPLDNLLSQADKALLRAKKEGRNRVCAYREMEE
jgi:diguanylate cyclase (GGDEF)-like protein/PAS domain S-box-containing protein